MHETDTIIAEVKSVVCACETVYLLCVLFLPCLLGWFRDHTTPPPPHRHVREYQAYRIAELYDKHTQPSGVAAKPSCTFRLLFK